MHVHTYIHTYVCNVHMYMYNLRSSRSNNFIGLTSAVSTALCPYPADINDTFHSSRRVAWVGSSFSSTLWRPSCPWTPQPQLQTLVETMQCHICYIHTVTICTSSHPAIIQHMQAHSTWDVRVQRFLYSWFELSYDWVMTFAFICALLPGYVQHVHNINKRIGTQHAWHIAIAEYRLLNAKWRSFHM